MEIKIDNKDLFLDKLKTGINIFTGAGFSCLPDPKGKKLPTGNELAKEICEKFSIDETYADDLPYVSESVADKQGFQNFLRERFRVNSYNQAYNAINKINISAFITTNIDNIVHSVIENGNKYFLSNIAQYGATSRAPNKLPYLPLHGDVTVADSTLYFGKFEMANVDKKNIDLFNEMHSKIAYGATPTLFWGYGFNDSGVLRVVDRLLKEKPNDIWVQCMPDDKKTIDIFRKKGCNIIIADTSSLLEWIDEKIDNVPQEKKIGIEKKELKQYLIPTLNKATAILLEDFYQYGETAWHPVLSKGAVELAIVNEIYNDALSQKNTILIGGSFTGKTTVLMQLALKVEKPNKLYVDKITCEQAKFIVKAIGNEPFWIFFHDCTDDIEAYKIFTQHANITIVGVADDHHFEGVGHLLEDIPIKMKRIGELTREEAQKIYNEIPKKVRKETFTYKENSEEKFSMFEMISNNVTNAPTRERVESMLLDIKNKDANAFEAILLTSYLEHCKSALSMDIIYSYFSLNSYDEASDIINKAQNLLRNYNIDFSDDNTSQDFFILRSKLFLRHVIPVLIHNSHLKRDLSRIVEKFTYEVNPLKIDRYDIFRRKAYDSKLFRALFGKNADNIYKFLYNYDENPYTLQQWALYCSSIGDHDNAFLHINKALMKYPNNFSMQNSRAIIFFEANKEKNSPEALAQMKKAMDMLGVCYSKDKRKDYHAYRYAEFACYLAKISEYEYIDQAIKWLEEIRPNATNRKKTDKLLKDLQSFK
jgi:tetratricopeptide (TPR) repeat protein